MNLRNLHRALLASAFAVLAFGAAPAMAANPPPSPTPFGTCGGASGGTDCVTGTGHAGVTVTGTLSVNEMEAISFGNIASGALIATDNLVLDLAGNRTSTGTGGFAALLLHGAGATNGAGAAASGSQHPGHYTITGGEEDASATQVYISFADTTGSIIDMCDSNTGGVMTNCDAYHGNSINVNLGGAGATGFTMNQFVINQSGSDVYGHYIRNDGIAVAPGIATPWLPGAAHGNGKGVSGTGGIADVVVGATLHGAGVTPAVGKYVGTFNIMASY